MKRRSLAAGVVLVAVLAGWMARDLTDASAHDIRKFDGHEVARLETAMWKSYYAHQRVRLFGQLVILLREQYNARFWRAVVGGLYAARSAAVFQKGNDRPEYLLALPDLEGFYRLIRKGSTVPFDVSKVSALELEWWIIHRQRDRYGAAALENSLAGLQAGIFLEPAARFQEHARLRAEAMLLRDARAAAGAVSEEDWGRIAGMLDRSWVLLEEAVR